MGANGKVEAALEKIEITEDEVLGNLCNVGDEGKQLKILREEVWAVIRHLPQVSDSKTGWKKKSFKSRMFKVVLNKLKENKLISSDNPSHKKAIYRVRPEAKAKVQVRIKNSDHYVGDRFIKILEMQSKYLRAADACFVR